MDSVKAALEAHRPADPGVRLRRRVQSDGRTALSAITREVIRDAAVRQAAIDAAVAEGVIRLEVVRTGRHPRVDLVWVS